MFSFTMYKLFKNKSRVFKKEFFKEYFKNHGSFIIKEISKKQGILKPGNFFNIILKLFKNPTFKNVFITLMLFIVHKFFFHNQCYL